MTALKAWMTDSRSRASSSDGIRFKGTSGLVSAGFEVMLLSVWGPSPRRPSKSCVNSELEASSWRCNGWSVEFPGTVDSPSSACRSSSIVTRGFEKFAVARALLRTRLCGALDEFRRTGDIVEGENVLRGTFFGDLERLRTLDRHKRQT